MTCKDVPSYGHDNRVERLADLVFSGLLMLGLVSCQKAVDFVNPLDPQVPLATPDSVHVLSISDSTITVSWSDKIVKTSSAQAKELWVVLERSSDGGTFLPLDSVHGPFLSSTFHGTFDIGRPYTFRIHSRIGDNISPPSTAVGAVLHLDAPSNLSLRFLSESRRQFTWDDNSNAECGFAIERRMRGDGVGTPYSRISLTQANATSFIDTTTLNVRTSYMYRISAVSVSGLQSPFDSLEVVDSFLAPTDLSCSGDNPGTVSIHWTNHYLYPTTSIVERATPNAAYTVLGVCSPGADSYVDNSVGRDNSYYYRVKGVTSRDSTAYSQEIHVVYQNVSFDLLGTLETGHRENSVIVSRDGATALVWAHDGGSLQIWGIQDHILHRSISVPYEVSAVAISGNGQVIGTAVKDSGTFCFYAATDGRLLSTVNMTAPAYDLQISDDGSVAITSGGDPTIRMWNTSTGVSNGSLTGHTGYPISLWLTDDGRTLVSGADKTVQTWNWQSQSHLGSVSGGLFTKPIFQRSAGDLYSIQYANWSVWLFNITLGQAGSSHGILSDDVRLGYYTPDGYRMVFGVVGLLVSLNPATESPGISIYYWARQIAGIPGSNTDFIAVSGENSTLSIFRMRYSWWVWPVYLVPN